MRKKFLFGLSMFLSLLTYAQKTESEKIKITYTQLPLKPLELSVKKVAIKFNNSSGTLMPPKQAILKYFKMEGFQLTDQNPDAILVISIDKLNAGSQVLSKMVGNGVYSYFYKVNAEMEATVRFLTPDTKYEYYRTSKFDSELSASEESSLFPNEKAASDGIINGQVKEKMISQCIDQSLSIIGTYIRNNFCYASITEPLPVYTIKSKDFDYAELDQAMEKYKQAMTQYSASGLTTDGKAKLEEVAATWAKDVSEYSPDNKKARISSKNVLELYMNLVLVDIWLSKFDDARKYFELATKEKGLNGLKGNVNTLLESSETGFKQNNLRTQNQLMIQKAESELYCAADFRIESNNYRIKYVEYYDPNSPKRLHHRKVFEYDANSVIKKVYDQNYDAGTKTFVGESNVYRIVYDNQDKVMSFFRPNAQTPEVYQTVRNGKIVSQAGKDQNSAFNYVFNYDKSDNLIGFTNSIEKTKKVTKLRYESGHVKEVVSKDVKEADSIPAFKWVFHWNGNAKSTVDFFYNPSNAKEFGSKAYSASYQYDANGHVTKIGAGYGATNYTYDANGNLIEMIIGSDDGTATHETYVWEEGSGNASLYLSNPTLPQQNALIYPQVF